MQAVVVTPVATRTADWHGGILQGVEEEQAQFKKRAKNTMIFYIIAESIWQIEALVFYDDVA